jgi:hypothetical protein
MLSTAETTFKLNLFPDLELDGDTGSPGDDDESASGRWRKWFCALCLTHLISPAVNQVRYNIIIIDFA